MKKKLAGVLAATLGLVLTFGMTVMAAPSSSTDNAATPPSNAKEDATEYVSGIGASNTVVIGGVAKEVTVTISPVKHEVVSKAQENTTKLLGDTAVVVKVFDVSLPAGDYSKGVQVTMNVPGVVAGQSISVLHQKADGTWEILPVNKVGNGTVTATFTSFSPVAIVSGAGSPKTGSVLPMAGVMMIIFLAGAAVCAYRLRLTK